MLNDVGAAGLPVSMMMMLMLKMSYDAIIKTFWSSAQLNVYMDGYNNRQIVIRQWDRHLLKRE